MCICVCVCVCVCCDFVSGVLFSRRCLVINCSFVFVTFVLLSSFTLFETVSLLFVFILFSAGATLSNLMCAVLF